MGGHLGVEGPCELEIVVPNFVGHILDKVSPGAFGDGMISLAAGTDNSSGIVVMDG